MIETAAFILSTTVVIFLVGEILSGNKRSWPIPLFHIVAVGFNNCYVYTPAVMYQVYFWGNQLGVLPV